MIYNYSSLCIFNDLFYYDLASKYLLSSGDLNTLINNNFKNYCYCSWFASDLFIFQQVSTLTMVVDVV